jgi:hypothetical protein
LQARQELIDIRFGSRGRDVEEDAGTWIFRNLNVGEEASVWGMLVAEKAAQFFVT